MRNTLKALATYCRRERLPDGMRTMRVINPGELQFCGEYIDLRLHVKGIQGPDNRAVPLSVLADAGGIEELSVGSKGTAFVRNGALDGYASTLEWHGHELEHGPWDDANAITDTRWVEAMAKLVAPAMASEETRYYFNTTVIDGQDIVATNGRIMATLAVHRPLRHHDKPFFVWRTVVPVLKAMLKDFGAPDAVFFDKDGDNMCLVFDGAELTIRTTENRYYPDWRRVIPKGPLRAGQRADVFVKACRQFKKMDAFSVTWADNRLTARLPEGEASVDMPGTRKDALIRLVPKEAITLLAPLGKRIVQLYQAVPSDPIRFELVMPVEAGVWVGVAMPARA